MQVSQAQTRGFNSSSLEGTYGLTEMDSHADTACLGRNFWVISHTDRVCEVSPYHPDYPPMSDVPIVQAATAYDDPESGETFVLVVNQGLYLGEALQNSLLNPNQLRAHGVVVDDIPKHLAPDPNKATHSIFMPSDDLQIPLFLQGVVSAFHPTVRELESCKWIVLTGDEEWNPSSPEFADREEQWERVNRTLDVHAIERVIFSLNIDAIPEWDDIETRVLGKVRVSSVNT